MANSWFRLYSEFATDPKVRTMSDVMQIRLIRLFCMRCAGLTENLSEEEIAYGLGVPSTEIEATKREFISKRFIDENWNVLNWEKRQFLGDSSYARVKKYRDKRQALGLTRGPSYANDKGLLARDGNRCVYCLSPLQLCIDHIYPIAKGGTDEYDNLGVACKSCNSGKAGRTPEECGYVIKNQDAKERYERFIKRRQVNAVSVTVTETEQNRTEQSRTEQKKRLKATPSLSFDFPAWLPMDAWEAFVDMRKKEGHPLTEKAVHIAIGKLEKHLSDGHDIKAILEESTLRGWRGLFPVENANGNVRVAKPQKVQILSRPTGVTHA